MEKKIKVGIAGLGRSGWRNHALVLEKLSDKYKIVAVTDPIKERRREAVDRFDCVAYTDYDSLISDDNVELVVVATPSYLHASQTIKALESDRDVVCEKPMATSLAEADAMIETAERTGRLLTIFQNRRYSPDFMKVREVIQSGKLGRIVLIKMSWHSFGRRWDWQTLKKFGGGELNNTGPHAIDQALQLFGEKEPEVFCDLQRTLTLGDAEDHVKIILRAPGAPLIDIEITRACAYPQDWWLIMGTRGGLSGSTTFLKWKYFEPEDLPPRKVEEKPTPDRSYNVEEIPWKEETWCLEKNYKRGAYLFYEDLYKTLQEGAPLVITPQSIRRVMWVIEKCRECADKKAMI
ncbi:TPA: Gfo/Idh/MocA family oxidoreductase [Candidatus Bathyarchaeota archaeon]|nr:Gfo/Idh/MocA family oxidoreductase [Candidatus Bathyarchaeota archaeon]